jgi:hypothetical protein
MFAGWYKGCEPFDDQPVVVDPYDVVVWAPFEYGYVSLRRRFSASYVFCLVPLRKHSGDVMPKPYGATHGGFAPS